MKKIFVILLLLVSPFVSCKPVSEMTDPEPEPVPEDEKIANSSTLVCKYNGQEYTDYIEINTESDMAVNDSFVFTATHYLDGKEVDKPFTFTSDGCTLSPFGMEGHGAKVLYSDLKSLGLYTITAKSSISSKYDKTFSINLTSNTTSLKVRYTLLSEIVNEKVSEAMKGGTATNMTGTLDLVSGGVYRIEVFNQNDTADGIRMIFPSSGDDSICYFSDTDENSTMLYCTGGDGKQTLVTLRLGKTKTFVSILINLVDVSEGSVRKYIEEKQTEQILSFSPNTPSDPDKKYEYIFNIKGLNASKKIQFSVDAEHAVADADSPTGARKSYRMGDKLMLGSLELEQYLSESPYRKLVSNPEAQWYTNMDLTVSAKNDESGDNDSPSWTDTPRFKMSFNGGTRRFSIVPMDETLWNKKTKNMHFYIYFKYADDSEARWKYRVMVGGVLEGMQMVLVDSTNAEEEMVIEDNTLTISDGDKTGWIFRCKYIPETYTANETYFYLADVSRMKKYTIGGNEYTLPIPAGTDGISDTKNKTLSLSGSSSEVSPKPIPSAGDTLQVLCYTRFDANADGRHHLWTTYGNNGEDVKLVALNANTGVWTAVDIKNTQSTTVVVRSVSGGLYEAPSTTLVYRTGSIPHTIPVAKEDYSATVNITTPYNGSASQQYPQTVSVDTPKARTFYMSVNSELRINIESSFPMAACYVQYGENSTRYISTAEVTMDSLTDANSAVCIINTKWKNLKENQKEKDCIVTDFLTTKAGTYLNLIINSEDNQVFTIPLRIIIYNK